MSFTQRKVEVEFSMFRERKQFNCQTVTDNVPVQERGAILLLVEMLVVGFLILAGIVIDGTILSTSKTQRAHIAEYVAFEALETYHETPGAFNVKLEASRARAEAISSINVYLAKPFTTDPGAADSFGTNGVSSPAGTRNGWIIPGIWHHVPPADCSALPTPCPCSGSGEWAGPCFEELDLDLNPGAVPNAFRADLNLPVSSPFKTLFAKVGGVSTMEVAARAIATVVPRTGVFLVDLSRSSHYETHVPYEGAGANAYRATESAFYVSDRACPADFSNPCMTAGTCAIAGGPYPDTLPSFTGLYDYIWDNTKSLTRWPLVGSTRPGISPSDTTKHYRGDYGCYDVTYTDGTEPPRSDNYLVDRYVGLMGTKSYEGPEPLTSMLHGVHEALTLMEDQNVPGDGIGLIGFDQSAKIQERQFAVTSPGAADFNDMLEITNIAAATGSAEQTNRLRNHMFFIRKDAQANYPEALREALRLMRAATNGALSRNFVVMMGDGISSCDGGRVCGGAEEDFDSAMAELETLVQTEMVPHQFQLHMLMIGDHARPHTMLTRSVLNPSLCMEEREARTASTPLSFVDTLSDTDSSASWSEGMTLRSGKFFHGAGRLYKLVRDTDGTWAPIRKACESGGVPADVRSALNTACAAATAGVKLDGLGNPTDQPLPVTVPSYTDSDGRLLCDPMGRSKRQQISEFMKSIVGGSPYVLVSPAS